MATVVNGRWTARKGQGHFVPRSELSQSQQTLLAAVPRWKRAWVRPASLKPNQSPNFKVLKWVLDTGAQKEEGTSEEMEAALKVVVSGQAEGLDEGEGLTPLPTTSGFQSGTATPALMENASEGEIEILPGQITPSIVSTSAGPSKLATETFPSEVNTPIEPAPEIAPEAQPDPLQQDSDDPPSAPPKSPLISNLTLPPNPTGAPAPVEEAVAGLAEVPTDAIDVEMGDGNAPPFVEDELQLAQEATAGMEHEA